MDKEYCLLQKCDWVTAGRPCVFPCMAPDRRLLVSGKHMINQAICEQVHNRERCRRLEDGKILDDGSMEGKSLETAGPENGTVQAVGGGAECQISGI